MESTNSTVSTANLYKLDGKIPVTQAIPFGLQHILAMFVANISPILIVAGACNLSASQTAMLIQSAMIIAGICTLIQLFPIWRIGSGLPIVMGISFTFVSVFCYIGPTYGYNAIVGAILVGGIIEGMLGLFAKYWIKLIAPIVAASVVTAIGFTQVPEIFAIFPKIVETVFAENCVAVVFIVSIILNLVLPKNMDVTPASK